MIHQKDVRVGVALRFCTPDGSPDLVGLVQSVSDGYVHLCHERWPLDVVARESEIIPQPSPAHRWDGSADKWYRSDEPLPPGTMGPVLTGVRHAQ